MNRKELKTDDCTSTTGRSTTPTVMPKLKRQKRYQNQNYSLIWIDRYIDQTDSEFQNQFTKLQSVVEEVILCSEAPQSIEFLNDITNETFIVICSGELEHYVIPKIHNLRQVDAIYILYDVNEWHKPRTAEYGKIVGAFTSIQSIRESLKKLTREFDHSTIPMTFVPEYIIGGNFDDSYFSGLERFFMYSVLFKEIISETEENDPKSIKDLFIYCRNRGVCETQLKYYQNKHHEKSAIWWYTDEIFLRSILSHALQSCNMETIAKMSFFIRKLHQQLEQLYKEQSIADEKKLQVYFSRTFTEQDFKQLVDTKGGFVAFNNFLSTTKEKHMAMDFVEREIRKSEEIVGVIFMVKINTSIILPEVTPFAVIDEYSATPQLDEILFTMHTVFRVGEIKQTTDNSRLWEVRLTIVSDRDPALNNLISQMKVRVGINGWYELSQWMFHAGHFEQAEEIYCELLENAVSDDEKVLIYQELGKIHEVQEQYEKAIDFYEKAIETKQNYLMEDDLSLASTYSKAGQMYSNTNDYSKSLEFYEKAQEIYKKVLPLNHPDLATSYNNIGQVYSEMGDNTQANEFYQKAYKIWEKMRPPTPPTTIIRKPNSNNRLYETKNYDSKATRFYQRIVDAVQDAPSSVRRQIRQARKRLHKDKNTT